MRLRFIIALYDKNTKQFGFSKANNLTNKQKILYERKILKILLSKYYGTATYHEILSELMEEVDMNK